MNIEQKLPPLPWDDLSTWLDTLEARLAEVEGHVLSLVDEPARFGRLRTAARTLLETFPNPERRPPLFGVPVAVKDVFHVNGLPTAAGSRVPPAVLAGGEAPAVTALTEAGALILGKAACTEFAYFGAGPTRNPKHLEHTPGGSSSGSAAAVAAGLCPLALGTQTIGSISRPAAFCGVVGYKPSYDRISREGLLPLAPSLDHVGPLALDVHWVERAAAVLCASWNPVSTAPHQPVLGIPEGPYLSRAEAEGQRHFHRTVRHLERAGYDVRPVNALHDIDELEKRHRRIVAAEAAVVHEPFFERFGHLYHEKTRQLVGDGRQISREQLEQDRQGRLDLRQTLHEIMTAAGIDLWVSPAAPGTAPRGLNYTGDPILNLPWSQSGLPTLTLPTGCDASGLPLGLQLAARFHADEILLSWGKGLEAVFLKHQA